MRRKSGESCSLMDDSATEASTDVDQPAEEASRSELEGEAPPVAASSSRAPRLPDAMPGRLPMSLPDRRFLPIQTPCFKDSDLRPAVHNLQIISATAVLQAAKALPRSESSSNFHGGLRLHTWECGFVVAFSRSPHDAQPPWHSRRAQHAVPDSSSRGCG